ncbi:MAG TPA: DUF4232 domain-containing protein [Actinomycetota bacterium]|nr:DUF4232 domain-containing protein [Actinomycetota bacterium]
MNQDAKIRELLHQMADEVPPHHSVPASIERRAKQRLAMNSVAIGGMIAALAVGAFVGVRALAPASKPTTVPFQTSGPATTTTPRCTSGQLRALGSLSGAAGSRIGGITLTNYSSKACTLTGRPVLELFDSHGRITSGLSFVASSATWQANHSPQPSGWPLVTLKAMGSSPNSAYFRLSWSNWCPQGRSAPLWRVAIPGSGTVDVINGMDQINPPPCNGPGMPSTIQVGPFEPQPH